jgi:hypothetical protein
VSAIALKEAREWWSTLLMVEQMPSTLWEDEQKTKVSKQRMVGSPMPYRGVKATTRTASATHKPKAITQTTSPEVRSHPFNKMTNAVQQLKFGLQTVGNNPSRKHEKKGWMRGGLIKAGMWNGDKKKLERLVIADYHSQLAAVEYGKH